MLFRERSFPVYFVGLCTVGAYCLFQWSYPQGNQSGRQFSEANFASRGVAMAEEQIESVGSCGPDRNYLLKGITALPADYRQTRQQVGSSQIPRACVTYIMQNFINAKTTKSGSYGYCATKSGQPTRGEDGNGSYMPCVTESYVNSVYNSLLDVSDCLNIPIKELMPKLANESGLHVNTLGPDADGGVGQLTRSALQSVYMRYENIPDRESTLEYYVREMSKSGKKSCQRIIAQKSAYQVDIPAGKKNCMIHEEDENCFKPWMVQSRCEFMSAPDSPLRNVLFTGIYYRTMLINATGVTYRAGEDVVWKDGGFVTLTDRLDFNGYIARKQLTERFKNLGIRNPSQEVVRQILVAFGFNGGIGTGQTLLDNYLKLRQERNLPLTAADLDFQNVSIAPWSVISNPVAFLNLIANPSEDDYQKGLSKISVVKVVKLDASNYLKQMSILRKKVRASLEKIESQGDEAATKKAKVAFIDKTEEIRRAILNDVFDRSEYLTLPEYMRLGHAWTIAFKKGGGAPGYLSFLAGKHKDLVGSMGEGVCTENQYLQF